jgi:hypothetical protein
MNAWAAMNALCMTYDTLGAQDPFRADILRCLREYPFQGVRQFLLRAPVGASVEQLLNRNPELAA